MEKICLIEWNVNHGTKCQEICNKLSERNPDIFVLTEVSGKQKEYEEKLIDYKIFANGLKNSKKYNNYNDVLIGIKSDLDVYVEDIEITDKQFKDKHPDWRKIKFTCKSTSWYILGVRFRNYQLSNDDKENQLKIFYNVLDIKDEDNMILIGDFNPDSALCVPKISSWSQVKSELYNLDFRFKDATSGEHTFSYQRDIERRRQHIGTSPDNVFIRCRDDSSKIKNAYYYWEDKKWPSDHAMLIVELEDN